MSKYLVNKKKKQIFNGIIPRYDKKISCFGKLLWTGNFTSGSITNEEFAKYKFFGVVVGGVLCLGNNQFGGCLFPTYNSFSFSSYGYRLMPSNNNKTLSITTNEKGGSDGTKNVAITQIYGIF